MAEYDYTPNSHKYKERTQKSDGKRVDKVVSGTAKTKKRNGVRGLASTFLSEDVANVKSYVVGDVLIPALKKTVVDMITNGVDMLVYGETRREGKRSRAEYVSYRSYSDRRDDRHDSGARSRSDYEDISFEYRGDADAVLGQMLDIIDEYGMVRVADMYDLAGLTAPYTANRYGWSNLRSAEVVRTRDGDYVIKLPRAMAID